MPSFLVKNATKTADKPDKGYGPMQEIALVLQEYGQAEEIGASWYTKRDTPLPESGSRIEGELEPSQFGLKFKKAKAGGFGGKGAGKSPEERRSIAMQHAQKCAVTILEVAAAHGDYHPTSGGDVTKHVETVAWVLFRQVLAAETKDRAEA